MHDDTLKAAEDAARKKVRRWGQGRIEEPTNFGPRALPRIRAYRDAIIARKDAEHADPYPRVRGRCPECFGSSLFLGDGGYVTCSRVECPNPTRADSMLNQGAFSKEQDAEHAALRAAAQEAATLAENIAGYIDYLGGTGGGAVRTIAIIIKAALDATPWEPSEELVQRQD